MFPDTTKRKQVITAISAKLSSIEEWEDLKTAIGAVTSTKMKNYIVNWAQDKRQELIDKAIAETGEAGTGGIVADIDEFITEVQAI